MHSSRNYRGPTDATPCVFNRHYQCSAVRRATQGAPHLVGRVGPGRSQQRPVVLVVEDKRLAKALVAQLWHTSASADGHLQLDLSMPSPLCLKQLLLASYTCEHAVPACQVTHNRSSGIRCRNQQPPAALPECSQNVWLRLHNASHTAEPRDMNSAGERGAAGAPCGRPTARPAPAR